MLVQDMFSENALLSCNLPIYVREREREREREKEREKQKELSRPETW